MDQIRRYICETIISQITQPCSINKFSEASSSSLLEEFGGDKYSARLAMEYFEIVVVSKVGT